MSRKRLTGGSAADPGVCPTLGGGGFGFLDEFAEPSEDGFVGGEHAAFVFEGFEDGEGAGEIAEFVVGDGDVALEVGAVRFGFIKAFGDGEVLGVGIACGVALSEGAIEVAHCVV